MFLRLRKSCHNPIQGPRNCAPPAIRIFNGIVVTATEWRRPCGRRDPGKVESLAAIFPGPEAAYTGSNNQEFGDGCATPYFRGYAAPGHYSLTGALCKVHQSHVRLPRHRTIPSPSQRPRSRDRLGIRPEKEGSYGRTLLPDRLTEEWRFNAWMPHPNLSGTRQHNAACPDPNPSNPTVYDRTHNRHGHTWLKTCAAHLLARIPCYPDLLDRCGGNGKIFVHQRRGISSMKTSSGGRGPAPLSSNPARRETGSRARL